MESGTELTETVLVATRELVDKEIEDCKSEFGKDWVGDYFNNFHMRFPDYIEPNFMFMRTNHKNQGTWTKTNREILGDKVARHPDWYSQKFLDQTPEQFYTTFDKAIGEEGFALDAISKLANGVHHASSEREYEEFFQTVLPIWIRLRAMGYTEIELSS